MLRALCVEHDEGAPEPDVENRMKPDTRTAMSRLIEQIRSAMPFDKGEAQLCAGECAGCSLKLLGYLEGELMAWDQRLAAGERPTLADLSRLATTGHKIHRVLVLSGILADDANRGAGATGTAGLMCSGGGAFD
jgi:hypothetical protein